MVKTITITEAQERFQEIIEEVYKGDVTYVITVNSIPKAIISPVDGRVAFQDIREDIENTALSSLTYN